MKADSIVGVIMKHHAFSCAVWLVYFCEKNCTTGKISCNFLTYFIFKKSAPVYVFANSPIGKTTLLNHITASVNG